MIKLWYYIYSLITLFLFPLFILFSLTHILFRLKYFNAYLYRFALKLPKKNTDYKSIWLHAVSVGEVASLKGLISIYNDNGYKVYLSTTTPTGFLTAQKTYKDIELFYFPFDYSFLIKRFLKRIKPKAVILCEMEFWPSFIYNVKKKDIKLFLVSGRLGDKEFRNYTFFKFFFSHFFNSFDKMFMQSEKDKERINIICPDALSCNTGNLKFDVTIEKKDYEIEELLPLSRFFCASSTHKGEEEIILKAYKNLVEIHPDLSLVIVPRHIHRAGDIETLVSSFGFDVQLRSAGQKCSSKVFIVDTIGELLGVMKKAEIVIICGSFVKGIGGHNIIEPALLGKCVICGEYMNNFQSVLSMFRQEDAIVESNSENLANDLNRLLSDKELTKLKGENAYNLVLKNKGVAQKIFEGINEVLFYNQKFIH